MFDLVCASNVLDLIRVLASDRKSAKIAGKITLRSEITDNLQLNIAGKYNAIIGDHRKVHIRTKENKKTTVFFGDFTGDCLH